MKGGNAVDEIKNEELEFDAVDSDAIMQEFDRESNVRVFTGWRKNVITGIMAAFSVYMISMALLFPTATKYTKLTTFMAFIAFIGFLIFPAYKTQTKKINYVPIYDIALSLLSSGCFLYYAIFQEDIIMMSKRIGTLQIVIALAAIILLVELVRRAVGLPIIFVAGAFVAYAAIKAYTDNPNTALRNLMYGLFYDVSNGLFSTPVYVCTTFIVLFIILGALLEKTGIGTFFVDLANSVAGSSVGGPAKVAVISSALEGMYSGSSVANTVGSGSITIPMMKKTGYKPEFAGAVEAAASTGGQIMPPIMGAAAFLMAEYMDLPYAEVAVKAILPAILYFTGIFIAVHLEAKKLGLHGISRSELPKWGYLAKNIYLILPLILLVWLVSSGAKTMAFSAALSILAAFVIGFVHKLLENIRVMGVKKAIMSTIKSTILSAIDALAAGAKGAITVAVACAMAGIIAGCITVTGLASILINAIVQLAGNATIVGLVLTMICCIVLGMGVPTTANYCIMASTCAPILIQLGFPAVAAHFFVFYFGIVADITPPVALAAYAGSAIAKSNPMKTGINATKLAIAAFIVPYIFAYNPSMLFVGDVAWYDVIIISITALLGLFGIAAALNGYLYRKIPVILRIALIAGGLGMMIPGLASDLIGLAVVAAVVAFQYFSNKKQTASAA